LIADPRAADPRSHTAVRTHSRAYSPHESQDVPVRSGAGAFHLYRTLLFYEDHAKAWRAIAESRRVFFKKMQESFPYVFDQGLWERAAGGQDLPESRVIDNVRLRLKNEKLGMGLRFLIHDPKDRSGSDRFLRRVSGHPGTYDLGSLSADQYYLSQLSGIQWTLANFLQQVSLGLVSCERLDKVFEMPVETVESPTAREVEFYGGK